MYFVNIKELSPFPIYVPVSYTSQNTYIVQCIYNITLGLTYQNICREVIGKPRSVKSPGSKMFHRIIVKPNTLKTDKKTT